MSGPALTLVAFFAAAVLLACALGGAIAIAATYVHNRGHDESGLGSDEEFVRELLGYQAPHHPMNGGRRPDDEGAPT